MSEGSCLCQKTLTVDVTGISLKSRTDAVNKAFANLKQEVAGIIPELIVYMRPIAVEIQDLETRTYTERFLFLFMPRKREKVKITLRVKVEIAAMAV